MYDYFNDNNLLAEQQYGFRKLHSTEFAAVKLADYISKQMESGKIPVREINLSIDHNQIEQIPVFNFLGIIFDENLSWKNHTKMIANKISRVTGILYRLKSVFPKEVLVTLYKTLIASYIHYGLLIWGMDCNRIEGL